MKEELFNEMIEEKLLKVDENKSLVFHNGVEKFLMNEFIFTISYEEALKGRVNIFRKGKEIGSISHDELIKYLTNEINDIIDCEILKRYK